jgi:ACS family tartrate transporter-like MFS transporter
MALVQGEYSFYTVRFLLGAAEAGFFPGVVFYLSLWLPAKERAKLLGIFYLAIPFAVVFGAVLSSPLLLLDGLLGLHGWQWLFVVEAVPAILLGLFLLTYLESEPSKAAWLDDDEKRWLTAEIAKEQRNVTDAEKHSVAKVLTDSSVLKFSAIYFCMNFAGVGLVMFLPMIVSGFGVSKLWAGVVTAIPYAAAAIVLPFWGRYSDRNRQNRAMHSAVSAFLVAVGLVSATATGNPAFMLLCISGAAIGIYAFAPPFWALNSTYFTGAAAATALAAINSIGNLSGFAAPFVMGWLKDTTGSFSMSLIVIAFGPAIAGLSMTFMRRR